MGNISRRNLLAAGHSHAVECQNTVRRKLGDRDVIEGIRAVRISKPKVGRGAE